MHYELPSLKNNETKMGFSAIAKQNRIPVYRRREAKQVKLAMPVKPSISKPEFKLHQTSIKIGSLFTYPKLCTKTDLPPVMHFRYAGCMHL